jgi:hypothetical protein
MFRRLAFLIGTFAFLAGDTVAQPKPQLFILPNLATAPERSSAGQSRDRPRSLEGWLVCNGAEVLRSAYPELFRVVGTTYGAGDRIQSFNLPKSFLETKSDLPVRGTAICPASALGCPVGTLSRFDLEAAL